MDGYIQLIVKGTASGQEIRNVFYYGIDDGGPVASITEAKLAAFLGEAAETFDPAFGAGLADSYTAYELEARAVDERLTALDLLPQKLSVDIDGAVASATDTVALYACIAMPNMAASAYGYRSLRRSYIAYGPLTSGDVNGDGSLTSGALTAIASAQLVMESSIVLGAEELFPLRMGRTVAPASPAVGIVVDSVCRPYASFRRSRLRRTTGT